MKILNKAKNAGSKVKTKGKNLANMLSSKDGRKDLVKILSEKAKTPVKGFASGVVYDDLLYFSTHYFRDLANPTPLHLPGYTSAGLHIDDAIFLATAAAVTIDGLYKKDKKKVVFGLTMALGGFITSQFQYGPL